MNLLIFKKSNGILILSIYLTMEYKTKKLSCSIQKIQVLPSSLYGETPKIMQEFVYKINSTQHTEIHDELSSFSKTVEAFRLGIFCCSIQAASTARISLLFLLQKFGICEQECGVCCCRCTTFAATAKTAASRSKNCKCGRTFSLKQSLFCV